MSSDLTTLDEILRASYESISGAAGQERSWDKFRSLFVPGARLMPVLSVAGEAPRVRVLSPENYINRVEPIFAWKISRNTSRAVKSNSSGERRTCSVTMCRFVHRMGSRPRKARTAFSCFGMMRDGGS